MIYVSLNFLVVFHHLEVTSLVSVMYFLLMCISNFTLSVSASSAFIKQRFQI